MLAECVQSLFCSAVHDKSQEQAKMKKDKKLSQEKQTRGQHEILNKLWISKLSLAIEALHPFYLQMQRNSTNKEVFLLGSTATHTQPCAFMLASFSCISTLNLPLIVTSYKDWENGHPRYPRLKASWPIPRYHRAFLRNVMFVWLKEKVNISFVSWCDIA